MARHDALHATIREFLPRFIATDPFRRFGAHSIGIGPRNGATRGKACLRVYVACKLPEDTLAPSRCVPRTIDIVEPEGAATVTVRTDIVEMPAPRLLMEDPGDTIRPVPGGASTSAVGFFGTGTIGGWALDTTDETVVMLSNAHVFGPGIGAEIIQPGTTDGGVSGTSRIGSVKRSVAFTPAPTRPTPADCNFVDAAIGMADDPELIDLTVLGIGPAIYAIDSVAIGDTVEKFGQTTELTEGTVIDTDINTLFNVPINGVSTPAVFCDLIVIENTGGNAAGFASNGDSGSVLFKPDPGSTINPAVGLVFAALGPSGVACKIQSVFDALDLDVLCASGYPAYLDGIAEGATPDPAVAATRFTGAERCARAGGRRTTGLAREVQQRLRAGRAGRALVAFIDTHRHELFSMLVRGGDSRRAATAALEPVLRGALTSSEVLGYRLDEEDVARIARVGKCLALEGSGELVHDFKRLRLAGKRTAGKSIAELHDLVEEDKS